MLEEDGKTYTVQSSDDERWATESKYYTSYEFSDIFIPTGATLVKVEIFVEHYEEDDFGDGNLVWEVIGSDSILPSINTGEGNELEDPTPFLITSLTLGQLNSTELKITNNDHNGDGKKTLVDYIYAVVTWTP